MPNFGRRQCNIAVARSRCAPPRRSPRGCSSRQAPAAQSSQDWRIRRPKPRMAEPSLGDGRLARAVWAGDNEQPRSLPHGRNAGTPACFRATAIRSACMRAACSARCRRTTAPASVTAASSSPVGSVSGAVQAHSGGFDGASGSMQHQATASTAGTGYARPWHRGNFAAMRAPGAWPKPSAFGPLSNPAFRPV